MKVPLVLESKRSLSSIKKHARSCNALCAGLLEFEVECDDRSFIVHLGNITFGCRLWDLSGIPCKHREQPEQYVHPCYSKEVYLDTYNNIIHPVPSHHEWDKSNLKQIQPPEYHKPTGRLRKQRKMDEDEPKNPHKASRKNGSVTYARCLTLGHNSRRCTKPPHLDSKLFKVHLFS